MKHIAAIATITLCAALTAQDSKPSEHLLRYHHEKGQVGAFRMTNDVAMRFIIDKDREMKMSTLTTTYAKYKILEIKAGVAEVELDFYRLAASMTNQSGKVFAFDTANKDYDAGPMKPMVALLEGKVGFKLSTRGTVTDIQVPSHLRPILAQAFGGKEPTQMFRQFLVELPESPTAVGSKWETKLQQTMNRIGKLDVTGHNKLTKSDETGATIEQVFDFRLEEKADLGEFEMKSATGTVLIDPKLALPAKLDTTMHLKIKSGQGKSGGTIYMLMKASMQPTPMPQSAPEGSAEPPLKGKGK